MNERNLKDLLIAELDAVYRLARHLCARSQEVDDLVQETYLRAFRAVGSFHLSEFGPRPWLLKILHNVFCTRYEANKREAATTSRLQDDHSSSQSDVDQLNIDLNHLKWDSIDERLKEAIDSLPSTTRATFLLSAVEDLKYREIAEITGVPVGTVMSRIFRARAEMTSQLGDYAIAQGWTKSMPLRPPRSDRHSNKANLDGKGNMVSEKNNE